MHVFYGRPKGVSAKASGTALDDQYLDQGVPGVPGSAADYDDFGSSVAFGDYNDDGCADLAVGAASDSVAGSIYVFYGSRSGLKTAGSQRITSEQLLGEPGQPRDQDFGSTLAAGDLNDDGVTDLALSAPLQRVPGDGLGTVAVLFGGGDGLTTARKTELDRGSAGIEENAGPIGYELTAGDFDGDGIGELAFDIGNGQVQVVEGNEDGFTPTMAEPLSGPALGVDDPARSRPGLTRPRPKTRVSGSDDCRKASSFVPPEACPRRREEPAVRWRTAGSW